MHTIFSSSSSSSAEKIVAIVNAMSNNHSTGRKRKSPPSTPKVQQQAKKTIFFHPMAPTKELSRRRFKKDRRAAATIIQRFLYRQRRRNNTVEYTNSSITVTKRNHDGITHVTSRDAAMICGGVRRSPERRCNGESFPVLTIRGGGDAASTSSSSSSSSLPPPMFGDHPKRRPTRKSSTGVNYNWEQLESEQLNQNNSSLNTPSTNDDWSPGPKVDHLDDELFDTDERLDPPTLGDLLKTAGKLDRLREVPVFQEVCDDVCESILKATPKYDNDNHVVQGMFIKSEYDGDDEGKTPAPPPSVASAKAAFSNGDDEGKMSPIASVFASAFSGVEDAMSPAAAVPVASSAFSQGVEDERKMPSTAAAAASAKADGDASSAKADGLEDDMSPAAAAAASAAAVHEIGRAHV